MTIVGMDPHADRDRWYLYDYFPGTRETDLRRYASAGLLTDWMVAAGFDAVRWHVPERLLDSRVGRDVLDEPMMQKNATSVLAVLTDEQYEAGVARIQSAVADAEAAGTELTFPVDISLSMVTGYLKGL